MRYAARRDNVEPELIGFARQLGGKLFQSGPMDWWLLHLSGAFSISPANTAAAW